MATTTNYSWTTPDDTDLVKDGAAAIRTLGSSVDTTTKALNPSTTLGDIEYRSSTANTNTRLGIGTTGQVLTVAAGVPSWATPAAPASGLNYVGGSSFTAATSVSINNCFSATYEHYMVMYYNSGTANTGMRMRLRASGSDNTTSNYNDTRVAGSWAPNLLSSQNTWRFPEQAGVAGIDDAVIVYIWAPFAAKKTAARLSSVYSGAGAASYQEQWLQFNATTSFDGFTIEQTSGSLAMNGNVRVYGLANS